MDRFFGNRLNILFVNAGYAQLYAQSIIEFFTAVHVPNNDPQRSILNTLISGNCTVALRSWCLVGKFITGPWQRLVDQDDLSILELKPYYADARNTLEK